MWFIKLCIGILICSQIFAEDANEIYKRQKNNQWFKDGVKLLKDKLKLQKIEKKAHGVILFIGDGMGISTVTAGRILDGQLRGETGEENILSWEEPSDFPNVALSKTYNTDMQTADSAGTATAFMTGVKARTGVISVNEDVVKANCTSSQNNEVLSLIMIAEEAGLSTGVVTTARLTHATPSTAYAHSAYRDWEADSDLPPNSTCKDIARQLIEFPYGDGLEVAFGGGRKNFLMNTTADSEEKTKFGKREDGRNLIHEWVTKSNKHLYVEDTKGFKKLDPTKDEHVLENVTNLSGFILLSSLNPKGRNMSLWSEYRSVITMEERHFRVLQGLFNYDHMQYSYERVNDTAGEPSLTEMVEFAIKSLEKNEKGYVLLVEAGRIDHGHHGNKAFQALHDTVELNKAVSKAVSMTDPNESLLIVTADHSHVFTFGGYQARGTNIFDFTNAKKYTAKDGLRFTSLGYFNGPGAPINQQRSEPLKEDLKDPNHKWQSLVPLGSETHGAEDVAIYARGTQAHLISGVVEQNYIFHVLDYALCLSESKQTVCRQQGMLNNGRTRHNSFLNNYLTMILYVCVIAIFCK